MRDKIVSVVVYLVYNLILAVAYFLYAKFVISQSDIDYWMKIVVYGAFFVSELFILVDFIGFFRKKLMPLNYSATLWLTFFMLSNLFLLLAIFEIYEVNYLHGILVTILQMIICAMKVEFMFDLPRNLPDLKKESEENE